MFSHILVVSRGYILLISVCLMLKTGKLHSRASSDIFKSYFKRTTEQLYKNSTDFFVLEVSTVDAVSRF